MSKKKKSPSKKEVRSPEDHQRHEAGFDRWIESVRQMHKKEGPYFERWKAGMKAYLENLESKRE